VGFLGPHLAIFVNTAYQTTTRTHHNNKIFFPTKKNQQKQKQKNTHFPEKHIRILTQLSNQQLISCDSRLRERAWFVCLSNILQHPTTRKLKKRISGFVLFHPKLSSLLKC